MDTRSELQRAYDRVAGEYVRRIFNELAGKPLDRALLDQFALRIRDLGPVCDVGCGPGHVARYLHERGVRITGIDLSQEMVEQARRLNPGLVFHQGDMRRLDVADGAWAGIVAFYSLIHVAREEIVAALRELRRTLRPGGVLLVAFHVGTETIHRDEWWGHEVSIDFLFFTVEEMRTYLAVAGFEVEDVVERDPYPEVEHPSRRAYNLALAPGAGDAV